MKTGSVESVQKEFHSGRGKHALVGALYGFLVGSAFVITAATVDQLLYPDLPLGMDWSLFTTRWGLIGLGLTLIGALTCLFDEMWAGMTAGTVTAGLLALASALFISSTGTGLKMIVLLFTLAPMAVMSLPVVWILRRLADKHARALNLKWSAGHIVLLALIAVSLGAGCGYFMKMSARALLAVRLLHDNLRGIAESQEKAISQLPRLHEHAGISYELFQKLSDESTEGFDVRAEYKDGYTVQCVVVAYPGLSPYIRDCEEIEG